MKRALVALAFVLFASLALGVDVTVAWDPNPPAEKVTGYLVYWGETSRTAPGWTAYQTEVDVGAVTQYDVKGLVPGKVYYFAAKAYNAQGLRSDYSNEIKADLTALEYKPPTPPVLRTVTVQVLQDGTAIITVK